MHLPCTFNAPAIHLQCTCNAPAMHQQIIPCNSSGAYLERVQRVRRTRGFFRMYYIEHDLQVQWHSVLVLFLTQTKSSEAETFFSISYDAKQVRISWENHLSTGFPLSYSTKSMITVARAVQNLGRNGLLQAGRLSNGKKIFIKLAQTCEKQMVKISERYLKPLLSN